MRTLFKTLFYILGLCIFQPVNAQQITVNKLIDFSASSGVVSDTLHSEIKFVFADTNQILVTGNVQHEGAKPHIFTAAFDYTGQLKWKREIQTPPDFSKMSVTGFVNLKKLTNGNFVVAGLLKDTPENDSLQIPFLYFFKANGDSLSYMQFNNRPLWRCAGLNIDDSGNILIAGLYDRTYQFNHFCSDHVWASKLNETGNIIWTKDMDFSAQIQLGINQPFTDVYNFMQDTQGNYMFSFAKTGGNYIYTFLTLADNGTQNDWNNPNNWREISGYPTALFTGIGQSGNGALMPGISTIRKKQGTGIYFACSANPANNPNIFDGHHKGLYYGFMPPSAISETWGKGYFIEPDNTNTDTLLMDDGGIRIREAVNGDLIILKKASVFPYFSMPFLMRTTDSGNSVWTHFYPYLNLPAPDTIVNQLLNDMAISPNGRIVLGGAIKSKKAQLGLYDTTGSISWLMVLDDSLHNQPTGINPLSPEIAAAITIYPNPATSKINLRYTNLKMKRIRLLDLNGRTIRIFPPENKTLRLKGLSSGIYLLEMTTNKGRCTKKVSIQ